MNTVQSVVGETVDWIASNDWRYFITLNFKSGRRSDEMVESAVLRFVGLLSKRLFGSRSSKRVKIFAVHERHQSGGSHVHLLLEDPRLRRHCGGKALNDEELKESVVESWISAHASTGVPILSNVNEWFKPVYDVRGALGYMLKSTTAAYSPALWTASSLDGRRVI